MLIVFLRAHYELGDPYIMAVRRALISGASIAGPTVAFWLAQAGWDVTVVERADRIRTSGYPIDIRGSAVSVVRRMGLDHQISANRYRHDPFVLLTPGGRRLRTLDYSGLLSDAAGGDVEITRGALNAILHQASKDHVRYVFGDSIATLAACDLGVDVTFDHHPPETFDVVIGADGIHSNVRKLAFGHESQFVHHLGPYAAVWDLPTGMFSPGTAFMYSHPGRTVLVERQSDGTPARAFLTFVHPEPGAIDRHDTAEIQRGLYQAFANDRWRTREIIDTVSTAGDVYFDTVSQVRMPSWSSGRVVVTGDAAYAPSFLSGQGTSIALAGAYVLASELLRHDRPEAAFAAYEGRLREFVGKNQGLALRTDSTVLARTHGQLLRRNAAMWILPWLQRSGLDLLLKKPIQAAANDLSLSSDDLSVLPADL
ncbi:FAD-dependent monooxygenase [Mycobacteroides abscessus]|uniref:FAD-dependent monooxygenase n=1 Tax=Mycobacteroides abscessus TaxID=36809 RepID=UPI001F379EDD|nr:FAD-dependent monooxygenase [Mycobacteroides abscessus]